VRMNVQLINQATAERVLNFLLGPAEKFSFHGQLLNAAALCSGIISVFGVLANYAIDLEVTPLIFSLGACAVFFALYAVGRWRGYLVWVVWAYLVLNYVILFFHWMFVDDFMGRFLPVILALACILPVLLSGWQLVLAFILNCLAMMVVYLSIVIFPWDVINEAPSINYLFAKFSSVIALGGGLSILALFVSRNYRSQQERIKKLTLRDDLTGLYNWRFFNRIFQREINRARRDDKYLSLLMIDIDNFKHYNDKYGHESGDAALIRIGRLLMRLTTRGGDYVFRLAGDEFAVIFSGLNPFAALAFSEKIRHEIEHLRIEHIGNSTGLMMTASMGLAAIIPAEDMNMDWYCYQAGLGLHAAREEGGNQVGVRDASDLTDL